MLETTNDRSLLEANVDTDAAYNLPNVQNSSESFVYTEGTLSADTFSILANEPVTVISGNGNIDYGKGVYDTLDLSTISSQQIAEISFATVAEGGTVFDVGDKVERAFDCIVLADGRQVLFEGIENIVFSDRAFDLTFNPDDPGFGGQWNLHIMGVQTAWNLTKGTDDILIGVQDTGLGVDPTGAIHPDLLADETWILSENITDNFFREAGLASDRLQVESHGTAVQGIISAETDNGVGIAGINWNSYVYNINVLDGNTGSLALTSATQTMIDEATSNGQKLIINMSLDGGTPDAALESLIANNQDDVLFIIASGNDGADRLSSPASFAQTYDNVIAVGASWGNEDQYTGEPVAIGTIAPYSSYGRGISVVGPTAVVTTGASVDGKLGYDLSFDGTSAAAPNVAGVASLVWSAKRDLSASQIKQAIGETAYDLGTPGYDLFYGEGFVNADAAVRRAIALEPVVTAADDNTAIERVVSS